jgi:hypothetical protein
MTVDNSAFGSLELAIKTQHHIHRALTEKDFEFEIAQRGKSDYNAKKEKQTESTELRSVSHKLCTLVGTFIPKYEL